MEFVRWNKRSRYRTPARNRPGRPDATRSEGTGYAIDKSESSYAINRPRAADCTSFSYLWPLC